jgi:hypothetical protein
MKFYELKLENDRLLKTTEFVKFCIEHQGQNVTIQVNNEGHCLRFTGVYDILDLFQFKSVTLKTWNILEYHPTYKIDTTLWDYWLTKFKSFDIQFDYTWDQQKIFGCFYGRPSAPRLGIAAHLATHYSDKSLTVTKFNFDDQDSRFHFDLVKLFEWHPESLEKIFKLRTHTNSVEYIKGEYNVKNTLAYTYKHLLIDIVSEPTNYGNAFYPTEKTVRAIMCRRPFIIMGSRNFLIYLRQMGFKTFYDFWSEDYDGYDGKEKYLQILKLIDDIAKKTPDQLTKMYDNMQDILQHNANLIKTQSYNKNIIPIND